ncbi:MAG: hypothetical protein WD768_03610 [Phycisphaeraceae bacterium]
MYYNNNEGPSNSTLSVVGNGADNVSRDIRTGNTAASGFDNVGFVEGTGSLASSSNYTVFTGLHDSEFTVSLLSQGSVNNNGISAIQIVGGLPPPPVGDSVGWNFSNTAFGDENLAPGDVAGAPSFEQANWNNHLSNGQGPGNTGLALLDSLGSPSGIDVVGWTQSSNNSWHYDGHGSDPDGKLMGGFANQDTVLTFEGVNDFSADGYTVVVYYGNNEFFVNDVSTITVNGQVQDIQSADILSSVGYVMNTDGGATDSNYAVFTNVSGDVLTVALDGPRNDGISAIQIFRVADAVPVPEPMTASMLILATGMLMGGRASRRRLVR